MIISFDQTLLSSVNINIVVDEMSSMIRESSYLKHRKVYYVNNS